MLYAIDYRDMSTAIHHLLLFENEQKANYSLKNIQQSKKAKYGNRYNLLMQRAFNRSIDDIEVNYRQLTKIYQVKYQTNNNGHANTYIDECTIINFDKSIDLY